VPTDPCQPSPCGPNSQCRAVNDQAVCSCLAGYIGAPPQCRPECVVSSECPLDRACINQKCADPCPNTCGIRAQCTVRNHNPICACPSGLTGDPFLQCSPIRKYSRNPISCFEKKLRQKIRKSDVFAFLSLKRNAVGATFLSFCTKYFLYLSLALLACECSKATFRCMISWNFFSPNNFFMTKIIV